MPARLCAATRTETGAQVANPFAHADDEERRRHAFAYFADRAPRPSEIRRQSPALEVGHGPSGYSLQEPLAAAVAPPEPRQPAPELQALEQAQDPTNVWLESEAQGARRDIAVIPDEPAQQRPQMRDYNALELFLMGAGGVDPYPHPPPQGPSELDLRRDARAERQLSLEENRQRMQDAMFQDEQARSARLSDSLSQESVAARRHLAMALGQDPEMFEAEYGGEGGLTASQVGDRVPVDVLLADAKARKAEAQHQQHRTEKMEDWKHKTDYERDAKLKRAMAMGGIRPGLSGAPGTVPQGADIATPDDAEAASLLRLYGSNAPPDAEQRIAQIMRSNPRDRKRQADLVREEAKNLRDSREEYAGKVAPLDKVADAIRVIDDSIAEAGVSREGDIPGVGWTGTLTEMVPGDMGTALAEQMLSPTGQKIKSQLTLLTEAFGRSQSGAAIGMDEEVRFKIMAGLRPGASDEQFRTSLGLIREHIANNKRTFQAAYPEGAQLYESEKERLRLDATLDPEDDLTPDEMEAIGR